MVGQRFSVTYAMNRKRSDAIGELIEFDENRLIRFRYHYEDSAKMGIVEESFELKSDGSKTRVIHTVDFSQSTLPIWLKWLIAFLGRFGKKRGEGSLDGIAALLE